MPWDKAKRDRLLAAIRELDTGPVKLMEVCGSHTMAIARAGIKAMLPDNIRLVSGPGCPVCVTPAERLDAVLELAMEPGVVIASYGDMLRVPGSSPGDSLQRRRAMGARVEIVYSPMDALELAEREPEKQLVFLGVGFETTAPGTAAAILAARDRGLKNFSVWSLLKTVEPALRALTAMEGFGVNGFICPGHVASIVGERGFRFLPEELGFPGVISGFEPEDILSAVYRLARQISLGRAELENGYKRAVRPEGNPLALALLEQCFEPAADDWRGLGRIEGSGLKIRRELAGFDAERRFACEPPGKAKPTACRCGEVICGMLEPEGCPMFGRRCTPEEPVGPCMVSTEGACAAAYKYRRI